MYEDGIARYLTEIGRVLSPRGRMFATAFLYGPDGPAAIGPVHNIAFDVQAPDNPVRWHARELPPLAAVAYAEEPFQALAGVLVRRPVTVLPGRWRGGPGPWFQDLLVA
jgi:hypothetical protein